MDKRILDIGCAKYQIDRNALFLFMEEAAGNRENPCCGSEEGESDAAANLCADQAVEQIFWEVLELYNEYNETGNLDTLVQLKCRLEEASLRYRSLPLAEEVLSINSCLPYERRIPCGNMARLVQSNDGSEY